MSPSGLAAGEARDENVKEGDDAVDDGAEDGGDASGDGIDDAHDAVGEGMAHGRQLSHAVLESAGIFVASWFVH